jgi:hypothetical protein
LIFNVIGHSLILIHLKQKEPRSLLRELSQYTNREREIDIFIIKERPLIEK